MGPHRLIASSPLKGAQKAPNTAARSIFRYSQGQFLIETQRLDPEN